MAIVFKPSSASRVQQIEVAREQKPAVKEQCLSTFSGQVGHVARFSHSVLEVLSNAFPSVRRSLLTSHAVPNITSFRSLARLPKPFPLSLGCLYCFRVCCSVVSTLVSHESVSFCLFYLVVFGCFVGAFGSQIDGLGMEAAR